jgi:hypothetical protein
VLALVATPAAAQQRKASTPDAGKAPAPAAPAPDAAAEQVRTAAVVELRTRPDSAAMGSLAAGTAGRVLAQSGEWTRVRFEAWVRADQLTPAPGAADAVTAAELRADPERHVGRVVAWRVQLIGVQRADELRPEMPPGAPYLLTRGPLPESGFVYVMVPRAEVARFRAMPPLAELTLRVQIRAARTRYLATPVVELVEVLAAPGR